jgi:hypothetical protein
MSYSPSAEAEDSLVVLLADWKEHPRRFVEEALGAKPEPWQAEALDALGDHPRIAIRSGHGIGKSAFLAWLIIWFGVTRLSGKIPTTAPTSHQLQDIIIAEVRKWVDRMRARGWGFLAKNITLTQEAIRFPTGTFAALRTATKDKPEALQGFHADDLLFVLDEASGIDDIIFEVAGGALSTKGAMVVMTANPTRSSGYFYNAFHNQRSHWHCMHVPCTASSQVSSEYVQQVREQYGEESNVYRVRVLGEFPLEEDDVLVPLHLVEAAIDRDVERTPHLPVWGLDVARFGSDDTALAKRSGNHLLEPIKVWRQKDLMQIAGLVSHEYREADEKPAEILVDVIGLGAGVLDRLRELGVPSRGVNVAESPSTDGIHLRLRDELYWRSREWFLSRDCRIPDDSRLIGELTGIKYKYTSAGKLQVESKDEMRKRGMKSPDVADAFCLTFAGGIQKQEIPDRYKPKRRGGSPWVR